MLCPCFFYTEFSLRNFSLSKINSSQIMKYLFFVPRGLITLLVLFAINKNTLAQTFNYTFHAGVDNLFNVVEGDSSYFAFMTSGFPFWPRAISLIKVEKNGVKAIKQYGFGSAFYGTYDLLKINTDTMVAGSWGYNFNTKASTNYLFYFNKNMDSLYTKTFPAPSGFRVNGLFMTLLNKSNILLNSQIVDTNSTDGDMYLIKTDAAGNEIWHNTFGGTNWECAYSSIELPDASILTLGWTRSFGFGNNSNRDVLLVKWDSLGNKLWHKTFGTPVTEGGIGISATKDGNYLLACTQYNPNTMIENPWIIKVDTGGNIVWQTKVLITGMCNPWWAKETKTGNIVCAGSCRNLSNNLDEGSIFLLDSLGNLKWERSFAQGNDHAYFRDVIETSDSGFICAGFCFEGTSGGQDAWLVKLDSLGCDSVGCATYTALPHTTTSNGTRQEVRLYPNPAKEIFYIKFPHAFFADTYTVTVTDMQGQILLYQKQVYNLRQDIPIFVNNITSGMYLVTIKAEEKTYVSKLVLEK